MFDEKDEMAEIGWNVNVDAAQSSSAKRDRYDLYEVLTIREMRFCIKMHRRLRCKAGDY